MSYQQKSKVSFSGRQGVLALVVVALVVGYRFASLQNVHDEGLKKVIVEALGSDIRREAVTALAADHEALAEKLTDPGITIVRMQISKPLLTFKSSEKAVVKVSYTESGKPKIKYFDVRHSIIGGYQLRDEASSIEYLLSFF